MGVAATLVRDGEHLLRQNASPNQTALRCERQALATTCGLFAATNLVGPAASGLQGTVKLTRAAHRACAGDERSLCGGRYVRKAS